MVQVLTHAYMNVAKCNSKMKWKTLYTTHVRL